MNKENKDIINNFITVINSLANERFNDGELRGDFVLNGQNKLQLLELVKSEILNPIVIKEGTPEVLEKIQNCEQTVVTLRLALNNIANYGCLFFTSFGELVTSYPFEKPTQPFYILEKKYFSETESKPWQIENYEKILSFISLILTVCDHYEKHSSYLKIVLFQKDKIEIKIGRYNLSKTDLQFIDPLVVEVSDSREKEVKKAIFKNAIVELLTSINVNGRFNFLLGNLDLLYEKYQTNLTLFLKDFSFEKVRNEFQKEKVEYISKINNVLTGIQNEIIAIPIAFIVAIGQFQFSDSILLKNVIITFGMIIFCVLICLLLSNQKHTLDSIKNEISLYQNNFQLKYSEIYSRLETDFQNLINVYRKQNFIIWLIFYIVFTIAFISLGLLLFYSSIETIITLSNLLLYGF